MFHIYVFGGLKSLRSGEACILLKSLLVCLFICLFVGLFVCWFVGLLVCLFVCVRKRELEFWQRSAV